MIIDQDINNHNSRRLISALNGDNVRDHNHDGKPDRKAKRGPCNTPRHHGGGGHRTAPGNVLMTKRQTARSVDARLGDSDHLGQGRQLRPSGCTPSCRSARATCT